LTPRASARHCTETSVFSRLITRSRMRATPPCLQSARVRRTRLTSNSTAYFGLSVCNTKRHGITFMPTSMRIAKPASSSQRPCKRNVGIESNCRNGYLRLACPLLLHMGRRREAFIEATRSQKAVRDW
jgi:hypothetical protein